MEVLVPVVGSRDEHAPRSRSAFRARLEPWRQIEQGLGKKDRIKQTQPRFYTPKRVEVPPLPQGKHLAEPIQFECIRKLCGRAMPYRANLELVTGSTAERFNQQEDVRRAPVNDDRRNPLFLDVDEDLFALLRLELPLARNGELSSRTVAGGGADPRPFRVKDMQDGGEPRLFVRPTGVVGRVERRAATLLSQTRPSTDAHLSYASAEAPPEPLRKAFRVRGFKHGETSLSCSGPLYWCLPDL